MPKKFHRIAETALVWERRGDLSENDRGVAHEVGELATFLSHRPFPHHEDVSSLHVLSCSLCRRIGAVACGEQQSGCAMGFAEAH